MNSYDRRIWNLNRDMKNENPPPCLWIFSLIKSYFFFKGWLSFGTFHFSNLVEFWENCQTVSEPPPFGSFLEIHPNLRSEASLEMLTNLIWKRIVGLYISGLLKGSLLQPSQSFGPKFGSMVSLLVVRALIIYMGERASNPHTYTLDRCAVHCACPLDWVKRWPK